MHKVAGVILIGLGLITAFDSFWEVIVSSALAGAGVVVMHLKDE